ncbi:hypothetical protein D7S86_26985 [Pararobbsia silviterrae]|uniref:Uncharacterized protein n=1 Tax=Pararobbsia silviterrae TaxID=1792498 RepID=A0A494X1S3_9BURK|nr:hypothetical protein D7S86_26985 [Pararobbsia silviterrae]
MYLGGILVGLIQNIDAEDDYAPDPASGVGDIHAIEYVPTMARHTLNVSVMVLKTGSLIAAGVAMENGDAVLQGNVFDIEVYDNDTGSLLRKYISCSYASGGVQISKHAIVVQNARFMALDVSGTGF